MLHSTRLACLIMFLAGLVGCQNAYMYSVIESEDGQTVALVEQGHMQVWVLKGNQFFAAGIRPLTVSPDGSIVATLKPHELALNIVTFPDDKNSKMVSVQKLEGLNSDSQIKSLRCDTKLIVVKIEEAKELKYLAFDLTTRKTFSVDKKLWETMPKPREAKPIIGKNAYLLSNGAKLETITVKDESKLFNRSSLIYEPPKGEPIILMQSNTWDHLGQIMVR